MPRAARHNLHGYPSISRVSTWNRPPWSDQRIDDGFHFKLDRKTSVSFLVTVDHDAVVNVNLASHYPSRSLQDPMLMAEAQFEVQAAAALGSWTALHSVVHFPLTAQPTC